MRPADIRPHWGTFNMCDEPTEQGAVRWQSPLIRVCPLAMNEQADRNQYLGLNLSRHKREISVFKMERWSFCTWNDFRKGAEKRRKTLGSSSWPGDGPT